MHGQQLIALTFRCMLPAAEGVIVLANTYTCHRTSEERSGGSRDRNSQMQPAPHLSVHLHQLAVFALRTIGDHEIRR